MMAVYAGGIKHTRAQQSQYYNDNLMPTNLFLIKVNNKDKLVWIIVIIWITFSGYAGFRPVFLRYGNITFVAGKMPAYPIGRN